MLGLRLICIGHGPFQDGESGWSSLHRALHFGHLAVASVLIESGASTVLEDSKSRTPVDLVSGPVTQVIGEEQNSGKSFLSCDKSGSHTPLLCETETLIVFSSFQWLQRYSAGEMVLTINSELAINMFRNYLAELIH